MNDMFDLIINMIKSERDRLLEFKSTCELLAFNSCISIVEDVASKYKNGCIDSNLYSKLAEYEDLDKQGLLVRLPCKVGTSVYVIPTNENGFNRIVEMSLLGYSISDPCNVADLFSKNRFDKSIPKMYQPSIDDFGNTWFLTQAEAEQNIAL